MSPAWKKIALAAGLALFVLALAALVAHFRFPYQAAARLAGQKVQAASPLRLEPGRLKPGRPFTYRLDRLDLGLAVPAGTVWVARLRDLRFWLEPWALLVGRLQVGFEARGQGGGLTGSFQYQPYGRRDLTLILSEVDLPGLKVTAPGGSPSLEGRLKGRLLAQGQNHVFPTGGHGSFSLGPGRIWGLELPGVPLSDLPFDRLDLAFRLEPDLLVLDKAELAGPQGQVHLSGRVHNLRRPHLDLAGRARLGPPGRRGPEVEFRLSGRPSQPRVRLRSGTKPPTGPSGF